MLKLIVKGVLLWITALSIICFISGIESLIDQEEYAATIIWLLINTVLFYGCKYIISYKEFLILSGAQWFNKLLK